MFPLIQKRPRAVLDIGIGFGFYGAAVRQWCDSGARPWRVHLTGVEAYGAYRNPTWDLYDRVVVKPLQQFAYWQAKGLPWDAMIMCDVIEHFTAEDGARELKRGIEALGSGGIFMVTTPAVFCEQGAVHGNEHEKHLSLWTTEMFQDLGFSIVRDGEPCRFKHRMIVAQYTKK